MGAVAGCELLVAGNASPAPTRSGPATRYPPPTFSFTFTFTNNLHFLDTPKMSVKMSVMTTVTTREIQRDTRAVRQRLLAGETLQWKLGARVVGHLVPVPEIQSPLPWPNLTARLRHLYRRSAGSSQPAAHQIYGDRD